MQAGAAWRFQGLGIFFSPGRFHFEGPMEKRLNLGGLGATFIESVRPYINIPKKFNCFMEGGKSLNLFWRARRRYLNFEAPGK